MKRREFLKFMPLAAASGCALFRFDPQHVLIRSDVITSLEQEHEIVSRGRVGWTDDGRIRVLYVRGTAYERGYQHGKLLRKEIQANIGYMYKKALQKFKAVELFAEAYERMRPFIPQEYIDEMHGLAHGARMPLETIHHVHVLADIGEWGGKKVLGKTLKQMLAGDLATTCSNIAANRSATADGKMYVVRILDWGLHKISRLHQYPLLQVNIPDKGIPYCNIGWVGYLGAVSGMNAEGITLGEMGYRDPEGETLRGPPMPFVLRDVLLHAKNLADVRRELETHLGTNSYVFVMSDGKAGDAEFYVRDRNRFLVFEPGQEIKDNKEYLPPIQDTVYGGRYNETLSELLSSNHGKITPELLMKEIIPQVVMKSNFQNVIYEPADLKFWVNNAASKTERASTQPYTFFDFGKALAEYR